MEKIKDNFELKRIVTNENFAQKVPRTLFKNGFPVICPFKPPLAIPTQTGIQVIQGFCSENCSRFELWTDKDTKNDDIYYVVTTCNGINPETNKPIRISLPLNIIEK